MIEDTFPYEQPVERVAQSPDTFENYDEQNDVEWEQEMALDPYANLPGDGAPFRRSPSPEMAARIRSPSVEISDHRRSPSVQIMAQFPPPVSTIDLRPFGANTPNSLVASGAELDVWQESVREQSAPPVFSTDASSACIHAASVQAIAQNFIALLAHALADTPGTRTRFQAPAVTIRCHQNVKVTSFAERTCDFRV